MEHVLVWVQALVQVLGLGVDLVGGGMGVFVGGAEAFGFGCEGFGWGAGVGTASVFSFGWLVGSSLVSMSAADAKVTFRFLVVLFFGEGSEGLATTSLAVAGSASSGALLFRESLSIIEALCIFTISSTAALILPL